MSNEIKTKMDLLKVMESGSACTEATLWVEQQPDTATAQDIWNACVRSDWMLWLLRRVDADKNRLARLACVFARSVLHLIPAGEERLRICVETVEAFLEGRATREQVLTAREGAHQAQRAADAYADAYAARQQVRDEIRREFCAVIRKAIPEVPLW